MQKTGSDHNALKIIFGTKIFVMQLKKMNEKRT
jgi:hypothetical protein